MFVTGGNHWEATGTFLLHPLPIMSLRENQNNTCYKLCSYSFRFYLKMNSLWILLFRTRFCFAQTGAILPTTPQVQLQISFIIIHHSLLATQPVNEDRSPFDDVLQRIEVDKLLVLILHFLLIYLLVHLHMESFFL